MTPRRILVASPAEPSGGSWLLNCFLELGIKVGHKPFVDRVWRGSNPRPGPDHIWIGRGGNSWELNPKAAELAKFLPSLTGRSSFAFRSDLEVEYVQDFPSRHCGGDRSLVLLMIRDPRDSIYSMYRRVAPDLSFEEFLRFPSPETLLDRPTHWTLFVDSWLAGPGVHVVRFEDYKRDAAATLHAALQAIDLPVDEGDLQRAVEQSSFEKAQAAERLFRSCFPGGQQLANRAGKVGEGRSDPSVRPLLPEIESLAAPVLRQLGYVAEAAAGTSTPALGAMRLSAQFLSFFDDVRLPAPIREEPFDAAAAEARLFSLLEFAHRLNADLIAHARLTPDAARGLHDSLSELIGNYCAWLGERLTSNRAVYRDGSDYFFQRVQEMRAVRNRMPRPGLLGPLFLPALAWAISCTAFA